MTTTLSVVNCYAYDFLYYAVSNAASETVCNACNARMRKKNTECEKHLMRF